MFSTLYSDRNGRIWEDKDLVFLGRSGRQWVEAEAEDLIPCLQAVL